jgi:hypothetical protein
MSSKVVLLCEDEQSACFARRFLKRQGFTSHDLREEIAPPGKGSGEQWVRERFANELTALRARRSQGLFVLTDADVMSVGERTATFEKKCREEGIPWRVSHEPVMLIIPRRNIETWLAYLRGENIDEAIEYPKYAAESDCREEVRALDEMCKRKSLRQPAPPSLDAACLELKRFQS